MIISSRHFRRSILPYLASLVINSQSFQIQHRVISSSSTLLSMKNDVPYGAWESPITSKAITAGTVGMSSIRLDHNDDLFWLESRSQEAGRNVFCKYSPEDPLRSERNAVDVSPTDHNVRTRVHEYGGGAATIGGDTLYYSEFATQRVMKLQLDGSNQKAEPITPDGGRFRFADGVFDATRECLIMVREDHLKSAPKDVVNEISTVKVNGSEEMSVLATGNDFYAAPRLSPDGNTLAYITWNHPNMPWDSTELRVCDLKGDNQTSNHKLVAGADGDTSIIQPLWHPQTGKLFYISDESGYYNIYREGTKDSILPMEKDFGGSAPGWAFGQQGFDFLPDGRLVTVYNKDGSSRILVAQVTGNGPATEIEEYGAEHGLPMMIGGVVGTDNHLFFMGGSPSTPASVYKWSLTQCEPATQLACSSSLSFPEDVISIPKQVEFETTLGTAFGYYYPPFNKEYECTTEEAPPLLVKAHGGPTACTKTSFNPLLQYWTSRGFAILDVDYGGSTGYGREYRRRLRGTWGIVDIDDVCAGAEYLVKEGLADPNKLCIDGGSAGGFTTLAALVFRDVFKAGCSLYGVADLAALAGDTHKFESRYLDGLVGRYPEDEAIYKERSPIESVEKLDCPVLLLQGDEDKIVPPNQAQLMYDALLKKGIKTSLKIYEGEQHGFRKAENIEDALDSELLFFKEVFGIK